CRHLSGTTPRRTGNAHPYVAPSNVYRASDGRFLFLSAPNDKLWERLATAMGRLDLLSDPDVATSARRERRRRSPDGVVAAGRAARSRASVPTPSSDGHGPPRA